MEDKASPMSIVVSLIDSATDADAKGGGWNHDREVSRVSSLYSCVKTESIHGNLTVKRTGAYMRALRGRLDYTRGSLRRRHAKLALPKGMLCCGECRSGRHPRRCWDASPDEPAGEKSGGREPGLKK